MKMTELKIEQELFSATLQSCVQGESTKIDPPLSGSVRFKCGKGEMLIYLSPQDILDVEALLRNKTKELGGES